MTVTTDCIKLIKHYEGLAKVGEDGLIYPYEDAAGYATIGYGSRFYKDGTEVTMNDNPITKNEALQLLIYGIEEKAVKVSELVTADVCPHQFDALVSFAYNLGIGALRESTLLKEVNAGAKRKAVAKQFMRWVYAGGKKLPGLVKRRNSEAVLYQFNKLDF